MSKREILFRGKRMDNGKWVEGYYAEFEQLQNSSIYYVYKSHTLVTDVDPETVCQYTGLTDKNGRKIFVGDICEIHSSHIDEEDGLFVIEWDEYCAKIVLSGEGLEVDFDGFSGSDCEVVGNIYDNPELIDSGGNPE